MTREDIIRMAREAQSVYATETWAFALSANQLERFADLVAAHEREACAKEADYEAARRPYVPEVRRPCEDIAASIRLRSKK